MPVEDISKISEETVKEFRDEFLKFENEDLDETSQIPKRFYPEDVEDFKSNDNTVKFYYTAGQKDIKEAMQFLKASFAWRKEFGIKELTVDSFPEEAKACKAFSAHGIDSGGHKIFWIYANRIKRTKKELDIWCKLLVYHLETLYQQRGSERLVCVLDLTNIGVSNYDMDLIGFLVKCFQNYYPDLLVYQLNFNMAWTLKTVWNIIKTWMTAEAIARVKFVKNKDVEPYIPLEHLPKHMGGQYDV